VATAKRRAQGRDAGGPQKRRKELPKVSTGIAGLDLVLGGGLPAGRVTLLSGGPGSGKSMIGLQCLLHGADAGQRAFWLCSRNAPWPCVKTLRAGDGTWLG